MVRITYETGPGNGFVGEFRKGRLRCEFRRGGRIIAGGQFDLGRMLRAGVLVVAALCLVSLLPPQPFPATASQPDSYITHVVPVRLPTVPALAALDFSARYEVGKHETLRQIAYTNRVSVGCLEALNPGVTVEAEAKLRLPRPGCEVAVYVATGGERLADLAAYWHEGRVDAYLGQDGPDAPTAELLMETATLKAFLYRGNPRREVTLRALVEDNAISPSRPLRTGQVVYLQLTKPANEIQLYDKVAGTRSYVGCDMGLPVVGVLSQSYGGTSGRQHRAIDIAAPLGSPITATRDGVVVEVGWGGDLGVFIRMVHLAAPDGTPILESIYGHVDGYSTAVGEVVPGVGTRVRQGDIIGYVGNNGRSTGSHTHLAVRLYGVLMPPLWFMAEVGGG